MYTVYSPEHGMLWLTGSSFRPAWPPHLYRGMRVGPDVAPYCNPEERAQNCVHSHSSKCTQFVKVHNFMHVLAVSPHCCETDDTQPVLTL